LAPTLRPLTRLTSLVIWGNQINEEAKTMLRTQLTHITNLKL